MPSPDGPYSAVASNTLGGIAAESEILRFQLVGVRAGQRLNFLCSFVSQTDGTGSAPTYRLRRGQGTGGTLVDSIAVTQAVTQTVSASLATSEAAVSDDPWYSLTLQATANISSLKRGVVVVVGQ